MRQMYTIVFDIKYHGTASLYLSELVTHTRLWSNAHELRYLMNAVINFIMHCNGCDANRVLIASLRRPACGPLYEQHAHLRGCSLLTSCAQLDRPVNALQPLC